MHAVDRLRLLDHEHESGAVIRAYTRTLLCLRHCRTLYAPTSRIPSRQHTKNLSLSLSNTYCTDNCGLCCCLSWGHRHTIHHSKGQTLHVVKSDIPEPALLIRMCVVRESGRPLSLYIFICCVCLCVDCVRARRRSLDRPSTRLSRA